jgi:hypothetical protein
VLLLDALALHRATRLITADTITRPLRERVYRWAYLRRTDWEPELVDGDLDAMVDADMAAHDAPRPAELIRCRWCASIYLAALIVTARTLASTWWEPLAVLLALSTIAVLLAGLEAD